MPPEDNTGAPPAAPAVTIEPTAPAAPEAAAAVSGAAAAPPPALFPPVGEAPAAAPEAPAAPAPVEKPALEPHTETPSLLATAGDKPAEGVKPADGAKAAEDAAAAPKPGEEGAAPPAAAPEPVKFEPFTLPEGVTLAEDRVKEFTDTLVNPELGPQDRAQALVDMHVAALQQYAESTIQAQHKAFGDMRREWRTEVMADEELGGAGHQTAMAAVARMRDLFVPAARREAFNRAMDLTGAGDHPEILRVFYNAARLFDEPAPPREPGRPPPNNGRRPSAGAHGGFYDTVGSGQGPPRPTNR